MARGASGVSARVVQDRTVAEAVRQANLNVRNDNSMVVTYATIAPWSGITGTPTTLAGYGITSPLSIAEGGTALSTLGTLGQLLRVNAAATALEYHTLVTADVTDLATASTGITKLGTIDTGVWQGTAIANGYIATGLDVAKLTTGTTLPANVVTSSLTTIGTLSSGAVPASLVTMSKLGSPSIDQLQEMTAAVGSAGYYSGGTITDGTPGTVNIAAGEGMIRATSTSTDPLFLMSWSAASNVAIATDTVQYIYIDYNGGSPTHLLSTNEFDEAPNKILIGVAVNEGGVITAEFNVGVRLDESIGQAGRFLRRVLGVSRDQRRGGLMVGETGTRNLTLSAGSLWWGRTEYTVPAVNTSGVGTFIGYYRSATPGAFTRVTGMTQWPNDKYDGGTGTLATVGIGKYANLWFYVEPDGHFVMVYGRNQYNTLALAESGATPSTLPPTLSTAAILIARLTFLRGAATAAEISSAFDTQFTNAGVAVHNNLSGLQGGTAGEYYHLTSSEYTGTGTGVFARKTSPQFETPDIGSATGTKATLAQPVWSDSTFTVGWTSPAGKNAVSFGTIVVQEGVTLVMTEGSTWGIL